MKQVLLLLIVGFVQADIYMHSIRGSNNRLDEANRERNNANRLFDSENNNRGGYNVGKLNFYEGETVPISFTNQHGCNNKGTKHCEMLLQAMCGDPLMRDGTTTDRIPDNPANCINFNCDLDVKFGRHESYTYYKTCENTERNKGLFTASQNLGNSDRATRTRQNPGGTRHGYECPEERDYYPYWRPSPWADVAMFTNDPEKCEAYKAASENTVGRWYCNIPEEMLENMPNNQRIPITEDDCVQLEVQLENGNTTNAEWLQAAAHGWPDMHCAASEATRANHLGLIGHKKQWTYSWKVPEIVQQLAQEQGVDEIPCVFRLRYNITEDYDGFTMEDETLAPGDMTAQYNSVQGNAQEDPSTWPLWEEYGLQDSDVQASFDGNDEDSREYVLVNNPQVDPFGIEFTDDNGDQVRVKLQLAINTAQYGRTFSDRTHVSYLRTKPEQCGDNAIKLVTVAGKRGNIVQTFPGHEYFMWPEEIHLKQNDCVHFAWTGSNTNPNNNDGQGKQGTDRTNIVPMKSWNYLDGAKEGYHGAPGNSYPAFVKQPESYDLPNIDTCRTPDNVAPNIGGLSDEVVAALATGRRNHAARMDNGNMEELDDASASFEMEPVKVKTIGCWFYVSTRNNNFSNRSQKGSMCVDTGEFEVVDIGSAGGAVMTDGGWISVPADAFTAITEISFQTVPSDSSSAGSDIVFMSPINLNLEIGATIEIGIDYEHRALKKAKLMHTTDEDGPWTEVPDTEFKMSNGKTVAVAQVQEGGWYYVENDTNPAAVGAMAIGILALSITCCIITYKSMFKNATPPKDNKYSVQQA